MPETIRSVMRGERWLAGTTLQGVLPKVSQRAAAGTTPAGIELWECDFNQAQDFTIAPGAQFQGPSGANALADGQPDASTPGANNTVDVFTWGRNNIGSPTTYSFYSERATGTGNPLHSSVLMGTSVNATGFTAYQPFFSIGASIGTPRKEFGFAVRARKGGQTGAGFWGLEASVLGTSAPLTTAGAPSATANDTYLGFFMDTAGVLSFSIRKGTNVFTLPLGASLGTSFAYLELRADVSFGSVFNGGFIDIFYEGSLVAPSGRAHSVIPTDLAFNPAGDPLGLAMSVVRTAVGSGPSVHETDYIGAWVTRQVHRA